MAAPHFEKIEGLFGESVGGFARRKGAVVCARGGGAGIADGDAARDIATRIGVAQTDFEDGGRAKASELTIALGKKILCDLVVSQGLLEFGAREAVANAAGEFAEVEALGSRIARAEKALEAAAQVLCANEEGFGVGGAGLDEADGGTRGNGGEEVFVARGFEVLATVEFQHSDRI